MTVEIAAAACTYGHVRATAWMAVRVTVKSIRAPAPPAIVLAAVLAAAVTAKALAEAALEGVEAAEMMTGTVGVATPSSKVAAAPGRPVGRWRRAAVPAPVTLPAGALTAVAMAKALVVFAVEPIRALATAGEKGRPRGWGCVTAAPVAMPVSVPAAAAVPTTRSQAAAAAWTCECASCCCSAHDTLTGGGGSLDSGDGRGQGGWSNANGSRGDGNGVARLGEVVLVEEGDPSGQSRSGMG
jgi:hypothetical protein